MLLEGTTDRIIRCAVDVHKASGPGLLESAYEAALDIEFQESGISFFRQYALPVTYRGRVGLLINFNSAWLTRGLRRFVL